MSERLKDFGFPPAPNMPEEMPCCFVYKSGFAFMYRVLLIMGYILVALLMQLVGLGIMARPSAVHQYVSRKKDTFENAV